jgi:N-acetylglutamate synthase-like GNAT family acetyltransferase
MHSDVTTSHSHPIIRSAREDDMATILTIINAAAEAYRDTIPPDCWHEPYMSAAELQAELAAGVDFAICEADGVVLGLMGIQAVRDVDLIRHAYVSPAHQKRGIGTVLIAHLRDRSSRQILVGTWAAATWAIRFYEGQGFRLVSERQAAQLLATYWTVSKRQAETSVVLASPALPDSTT